VPVIWRCHVGIDSPSALARRAWSFLRPYVEPADACVFSREAFIWEGLDRARIELIAPVIDAFSAKNQELDDHAVSAILHVAGLNDNGGVRGDPTFLRLDDSPGAVHRPAKLVEERALRADDPMVLQVSRWDRLKDPAWCHPGLRRVPSPGDRRAPRLCRSHGRGRVRGSGRSNGPARRPGLPRERRPRRPGARAPGVPADGRPRGERGVLS
jgi:hypothetical protein